MQNIIIDEEFRFLLPTLDKETLKRLENNLLLNGCRDALVLWEGILIDGYNRYKICKEFDIPFTTVSMDFGSREEALIWIVENQISRRNLSSIELSHFRGMHFNAAKRLTGSSNQYTAKSARHQSDGEQKRSSTAKEVGRQFNVSKATIERDSMVANALVAIGKISPEAKRKILSGEVPVDRNKLQKLSKASSEEIEKVANQIVAGTYDRNDYRKKGAPESSQERYGAQLLDGTPAVQAFPVQYEAGSPEKMTHFPDASSEQEYIDTIVSHIKSNLERALKSLSNNSSLPELRTSMRSLINSLEDLYSNIWNW